MKPSPWSPAKRPSAGTVIFVGLTLLLAGLCLGILFAGCSEDPATTVTGGSVQLGDKFASSNDGVDNGVEDGDVIEYHVGATPQPAEYHVGAASQPVPASQPAGVSVEVDGRKITTAAGLSVDYKHTTRHVTHNRDIPATTSLERHAAATGPSLSTNKDAGNFDGKTPPGVELKDVTVTGAGGSGAKGGGSKGQAGSEGFSWTTIKEALASHSGELWLWAIGAGIMLLGWGYAAFERFIPGGKIDWELVIGAQVVGLGFIATALTAQDHPGVLVFLFLAIVGVLAWYVYQWSKKNHLLAGLTLAPSVSTPKTPAASMGLQVGGAAAPLAPAAPTANTATPTTA